MCSHIFSSPVYLIMLKVVTLGEKCDLWETFSADKPLERFFERQIITSRILYCKGSIPCSFLNIGKVISYVNACIPSCSNTFPLHTVCILNLFSFFYWNVCGWQNNIVTTTNSVILCQDSRLVQKQQTFLAMRSTSTLATGVMAPPSGS